MHRLLCATVVALFATAGLATAQDMQASMGGMHGMHAAPSPPTRHIDVAPGAFGVALPDLGVEIIAVRLTAAGEMLDLRYRVLDPAKAKPLMDPAVPFSVVDQGTGAQGEIPVDEQIGSLRQSATQLRPGQVLASLFGNPGRAVKKGDKVNLRLGDLEIVGLTIQG